MSLLTALALLQYDGPLEPMWRLNPEAHAAFLRMGTWAVALMIVVCCACLASAIGLWNAKVWGFRLAFGVLTVNLLGDLTNALLRQDLRTLIGIPIGVGLLWYLRQLHRRGEFVRVSH
jgi:integral membrane sensor domain MASE1